MSQEVEVNEGEIGHETVGAREPQEVFISILEGLDFIITH